MPAGRPTTNTPEIQKAICLLLIKGKSLNSICQMDSMPSKSSVYKWLAEDPIFSDKYTRARNIQADMYFEEIVEISDDGSRDYHEDKEGRTVPDHDHINRSRLRVDARKWVVARMSPKKYGEKTELGISGPNGGPIETKSYIVQPVKSPHELKGKDGNDQPTDS